MRPESIDDVDGILVYADQLMSGGDPHGSLIALQHGNKTPEAEAWLRRRSSAISPTTSGST
jgi:uncharacterized protein (TIGR02996 family)